MKKKEYTKPWIKVVQLEAHELMISNSSSAADVTSKEITWDEEE